MRDFSVAAVALVTLVLIAIAPAWERTHGSSAAAPTPNASGSARPVATPISAPYDASKAVATGPGFAVCGANDNWRRPSEQEENAHLAADPRYQNLRTDDGSWVAQRFNAPALFYDSSGLSSRAGLVMSTGLWTDPALGGTGCMTKEPQIWLFGYAPARYVVKDGASATLHVRAQPGYRMVVLTGEPRAALTVFDGQRKLALLRNMDVAKLLPSPSPIAVPSASPAVSAPLELRLYPSCTKVSESRHADDLGMTWYFQCGAGKVNVGVPGEATAQGWIYLGGDAPDGMQLFRKGALWMQIFFRRDGAGIEAPFGILQTYRPLALGPAVSPARRPTP